MSFRQQVEQEVVYLRRQLAALEAYLHVGAEVPSIVQGKPKRKYKTQRKPVPRKLPPLEGDHGLIDKAVALYQGGRGLEKIADDLGVGRRRIQHALADRGIQIRSRTESIRLAKKLWQDEKAAKKAITECCIGCRQKFRAEALDHEGRCWHCR